MYMADTIYDTIVIRTRFETFMRTLITPDISRLIDDFIMTKNAEGHAMFKYGGRAWKNVLGKLVDIGTLAPFEQACFLEGNYDIMLFPNTDISFANVLTYIQTMIEAAILKQFQTMEHLHSIYKLSSHVSVSEKQTISNGYSYHLMLEVIRPENELGYKLTVGDSPYRSVFYFEMSEYPLNDIGLFKDLAISKTDPTFVSEIGLLLVSSLLLVDRETEKGMSVDTVRNEYMQHHIIPSIMSMALVIFHHTFTTIEDFYNFMFVILFDRIFGEVDLYKNAQSEIMQTAFKTHTTVVTVGDQAETITYNSFMEQFNNRLLDAPCGGNPRGSDMPSFRVLINWMLIMFRLSGNESYQFEKSGGDAIRFYLPDIIKSTTDIDTKLFYSGIEKRSIQDKIILVVMVLLIFMEKCGYFRIRKETIHVQFGTAHYEITFDTDHQPHLLSCRFLPFFMVPLVSIDLRIKCYVTCIIPKMGGYISGDEARHDFGWAYNNAILDVAFNRTTRETIRQKQSIVRHLSFDQLPKNASASAVQVDDGWILTPLPTKDYLIADIEKMHSVPILLEARKRAGKYEKDLRRIALLRQATDGIQDSQEVLTTLEQVIPVSPAYNKVKNNLLWMMKVLFSHSVDLHDSLILDEVIHIITHFFVNLQLAEKGIGEEIILFAMYLAEGKEEKRKLTFSDEVRTGILDQMRDTIGKMRVLKQKETDDALARKMSTRSKRTKTGGKKLRTKRYKKNKRKSKRKHQRDKLK